MFSIEKLKELSQIKFARDSIWTIVSHFFVGISGLLINTIIGNRYHAEGLGVMNQGLSIYMLLALVANFGIQTSAQKHASQFSSDLDTQKKIFTNAVLSTAICSLSITLIFYGSLVYYPNWLSSQELVKLVKVLVIATPFFAVNKTINNFFVGLRFIIIYANIRIIRWVGVIIGILWFRYLLMPLHYIGYVFISAEVIIFIFFCCKTTEYWGKSDKQWLLKHTAFGMQSVLAEFVSTFNTRAPILIIGYILSNAAAGYFSYVETFARSILMISGALQKNFSPVFTKLWYAGKVAEIKEKMHKVFKFILYSFVPAIGGLYIFFYSYTYLFMPEEYLELTNVLLVLLIGIGIRYLYSPFSTLLIMTNHLYWNFIRTALISALTIILSIFFVKQYDIMGASIALSCCMIFELVLLEVLYRNIIELKLTKTIVTGYD